MKIAILGAGAMGSLYGGYLSQFHDVCLVDVWEEHVRTIQRQGLTVEEADGACAVFRPSAATGTHDKGVADLVMVFVKSIHTKEVLEKNRDMIGPDTVLVSLQNGYGNGDDMQAFAPVDHILVGTTAHGCTMRGPGHIFHAGEGKTCIGALGEDQSAALRFAQELGRAGFETSVHADILTLVWSKLFTNIGINPITALLDVPNSFISEDANARWCARMAVQEAVSVANARGMAFDPAQVVRSVEETARKTGKNMSSMRADICGRRRTEIGKINGAVVRQAEELRMPTPYNAMLERLILAKESANRQDLQARQLETAAK